jgi:hypothetical protein
VHQNRVQFCWKAVTGMIVARSGGMASVMAAEMA